MSLISPPPQPEPGPLKKILRKHNGHSVAHGKNTMAIQALLMFPKAVHGLGVNVNADHSEIPFFVGDLFFDQLTETSSQLFD